MELVKKEMQNHGITQYISFAPSMKKLENLFRKYEVKAIAHQYYDGEDDENSRLNMLNWVDEYSEGQWEFTQTDIDQMAWSFVRRMRNLPRKDSWYLCQKNGEWWLYIYGRDSHLTGFCDSWIIFQTRRKSLHMKWKRTIEEEEL